VNIAVYNKMNKGDKLPNVKSRSGRVPVPKRFFNDMYDSPPRKSKTIRSGLKSSFVSGSTRKSKGLSLKSQPRSAFKSQDTLKKRRSFFPKSFRKEGNRRGLTSLLASIHGPNTLNKLRTMKLKPRKALERGSADSQCNSVIGHITYETPYTLKRPQTITKCWLCGLTLIEGEGNKPECEHILPIAEAAMFLGLHNSKRAYDKLVEKEYGWSHEICNREKGVTFPLLEHDEKIIVDENAIKGMLDDIINSKREHANKLRKRILTKYHTKDTFIRLRTEAIKEVYMGIIDAIGGNKRERGSKLITLASLSRLFNTRPEVGPYTKGFLSALKGKSGPRSKSAAKLNTMHENTHEED